MNLRSFLVFLVFLNRTVTSRFQAYCTTPRWVAVVGKRLDSVPQLASSCRELNDCKSECSYRSDCVSFDCQTASAVQSCRLFALHGSLIDDASSTHWQHRRTCTTIDGTRCDFIYMGHYMMTSPSVASVTTAADNVTCLLTCLSDSSCRVAAYQNDQCQHWSQAVRPEARPVSGWTQFQKECQVNFMSAVLDATRTSLSYPIATTFQTYWYHTTIDVNRPITTSWTPSKTTSTSKSTSTSTSELTTAAVQPDDTYRYLFIVACVLIVLLCVAVGLAYHRQRLSRTSQDREPETDIEVPTTSRRMADDKDEEHQSERAEDRYVNRPYRGRNRPQIYENSPEPTNAQVIYQNYPESNYVDVEVNYENVQS